jgi:hypothetical protein
MSGPGFVGLKPHAPSVVVQFYGSRDGVAERFGRGFVADFISWKMGKGVTYGLKLVPFVLWDWWMGRIDRAFKTLGGRRFGAFSSQRLRRL